MSQPVAAIVLDNEAVQALYDSAHAKHRAVLAHLEAGNQRRAKSGADPRLMVPIAVRIEAGWDRTQPAAANANRILPMRTDVALEASAANRAVQLRAAAGGSVVDATVAQVAESAPQPAVVLTSDVDDMRRLSAELAGDIRIVQI